MDTNWLLKYVIIWWDLKTFSYPIETKQKLQFTLKNNLNFKLFLLIVTPCQILQKANITMSCSRTNIKRLYGLTDLLELSLLTFWRSYWPFNCLFDLKQNALVSQHKLVTQRQHSHVSNVYICALANMHQNTTRNSPFAFWRDHKKTSPSHRHQVVDELDCPGNSAISSKSWTKTWNCVPSTTDRMNRTIFELSLNLSTHMNIFGENQTTHIQSCKNHNTQDKRFWQLNVWRNITTTQ